MAKLVGKPKAKPSDKKKLGEKKAPPKGKEQAPVTGESHEVFGKNKEQAPVTGTPFEVFGKK